MTAAAADRICTRYGSQKIDSYPVAASTKIYQGTMVCINASGYAVPAANTVNFVFVGVARDQADNSSGANGAINVKVDRKGVVSMISAGLAITDVGKDLFAADDQTVTLTEGYVKVGRLERYTSATEALVDLNAGITLGNKRRFVISGFVTGPVGASAVTVIEDFEHPKAFKVLAGYATCLTAPSSSYTTTITLTDGTTSFAVVISATAKKGENETPSAVIAGAADVDVTVIDSSASALTANINFHFVCEEVY